VHWGGISGRFYGLLLLAVLMITWLVYFYMKGPFCKKKI